MPESFNKNIKIIIWLAALLIILHGLVWLKLKVKTGQSKGGTQNKEEQAAKEDFFSGFIGEKIVYDVKLSGITLGKAKFHHVSRARLSGREVNLMTFETSLARFSDREKIYSDLRTFLPLKIERNIFIWPNQERITEDYDQVNFRLNITKMKGERKEERLIVKEGPIHNAILLPFHVRMVPQLGVGFSLVARLPTQEFVIKLTSIEDVSVPAGTFKSYRFQSTPRKFEIWISADERKIPVKIRGAGFMGYTLVMKDHSL